MNNDKSTPATSNIATEMASAATFDGNNGGGDAFFNMLSEGFAALREHQYGPSDAQIQLESTPEFLRHAIINFIDPTASSVSSLQFSPGRASSSAAAATASSLELYEKLTFILKSEYNSTLKRVPYTNFRSGAYGVIDSLTLKTYMTGSQGGLMSINPNDCHDIPWADTGSVTGQGADPSEWHKGPYCHVYLAACENLEHYRTKVKPSIQAFLSQIDAVAKYNVGGKDSLEVTTSASQYVIVFVPSGDNNNKSSEDGPKGPGGKLGMWASARQRMAAREGSNKEERESSSGTAATSSNSNNDCVEMEDFTSSGQNALMGYLSRVDKEIMRRLSNDFSAGIVCQLSTLVVDVSEDELDVELKKMEWAALLKGLGTAVVNGFRERCRKYDDEIRKLDQLRGVAKQATLGVDRFDYSSFFLVKESLAFSYQQLNLPGESSLQYDELQAIIPEMKGNARRKSGGALFAFSANGESSLSSTLSHGSMSGDPTAFRKRLRSVKDLQPLAHIIQQYIFARQTELSFKTKRAVEVVERCLSFVQVLYRFKHDLVTDLSDKRGLSDVESWAFNFCWDVKKACEKFYSDGTESMSMLENDGLRAASQSDRALACCLCELLEFARSRFLILGDLALSDNPIRKQVNILSHGFDERWAPWTPMAAKSALDEDDDDDGSESSMPAVSTPSGNLLQDSLESPDSYLTGYLDLLKLIEATNRLAERHRSSARIAIEMAGIHVHRNDLLRATFALRAASGVYARDHWDITRFLILLRLASFQRLISTAEEYISTLVQCFSPAFSKSAPILALEALQIDFEAVLSSSLISRPKFSSVLVFDPVVGLEGLSSVGRSLANKDIMKKVYVVGDKAKVTLTLHSSLPKAICAQEISIDLVPFRAYVSTMEESRSGECALDFDDARTKILHLSGSVQICPGENEFSFDWYPRIPGQYVLASVSVKWNNVRFAYTTKELKRPTVRADVLPASPTQSMSISPEYLLPGQTQPVTITYSAGSDTVSGGLVKLTCSDGLSVLPPDTDSPESGDWLQSSEAALGPCKPGEIVHIKVLVKSDNAQIYASEQGLQTLDVAVSADYQAPVPEGAASHDVEGDDGETFFEKNVLEANIAALAERAFSLKSKGISFCSRTHAMVYVTLQCNTPTQSKIKLWSMSLPSFVKLVDGGDLNAMLMDSHVETGEQVTFAFSCESCDAGSGTEAQLAIEFEDVQQNLFKEELSLNFRRPAFTHALPSLEAIPIEVSPSASQGTSLEPIIIKYMVNTSDLVALPGEIKYKLWIDHVDWMISGQVEGLVDCTGSTFAVTIVALPTRPGTIEEYPTLLLYFLGDQTATEMVVPLQTKVSSAHSVFDSISAAKHTTVAVPQVTKESRITA